MTLLYSQREMIVMQSASQDAEGLVETTWNGTIPVDPVIIARRIGIDVVEGGLAPDVSGALVKSLGQDAKILLNASDHPNRKRFTCAHELGHFVRRTDEAEEYSYVDLRSPLSSMGLSDDEVYANQFAASLLMPAARVRDFRQRGMTDVQLAAQFAVSREAMQYRLKNLGIAL